jgi:predicted CoA-binding protein
MWVVFSLPMATAMNQSKAKQSPEGSSKAQLNQRLQSLDALFRPRSVAVIGAGRTPNTIGHEIVRNLVEAGFTGPVYPVNPKAKVVRSMHCYPNVAAIPGAVDLALLVVPAVHVIQAARECGKKGRARTGLYHRGLLGSRRRRFTPSRGIDGCLHQVQHAPDRA